MNLTHYQILLLALALLGTTALVGSVMLLAANAQRLHSGWLATLSALWLFSLWGSSGYELVETFRQLGYHHWWTWLLVGIPGLINWVFLYGGCLLISQDTTCPNGQGVKVRTGSLMHWFLTRCTFIRMKSGDSLCMTSWLGGPLTIATFAIVPILTVLKLAWKAFILVVMPPIAWFFFGERLIPFWKKTWQEQRIPYIELWENGDFGDFIGNATPFGILLLITFFGGCAWGGVLYRHELWIGLKIASALVIACIVLYSCFYLMVAWPATRYLHKKLPAAPAAGKKKQEAPLPPALKETELSAPFELAKLFWKVFKNLVCPQIFFEDEDAPVSYQQRPIGEPPHPIAEPRTSTAVPDTSSQSSGNNRPKRQNSYPAKRQRRKSKKRGR